MREKINRQTFNRCQDLVYGYLSFIRLYIKSRKAADPDIAKTDKDFDMYEILFCESLKRALGADTKNDYTVFSDNILNEVADGIRKILKERKSLSYARIHRGDMIFMCGKIFHGLVDKSRNITEQRMKQANG